MVSLQLRSGRVPEIRQLGERHVDLHRSRARLVAFDVADELARQRIAFEQLKESDFRVNGAYDHRGAKLLTAIQNGADHAIAFRQNLRYARIGSHHTAGALGGTAERIGYRPHATLRIAPRIHLAFAYVTDCIVK